MLNIQDAILASAHITTISHFLTRMADHKYTRETVRQFVTDAKKALEMMPKRAKV